MKKTKTYVDVRFAPHVIRDAKALLVSFLGDDKGKEWRTSRHVQLSNSESWEHDSDEEFFADLRRDYCYARYGCDDFYGKFCVEVIAWARRAEVGVAAPVRTQVEAVFEIFEKAVSDCILPPSQTVEESRPRIFIGHGQGTQWRDLKDHLHEKHGYDIEAYEVGARAGHTIRDILEEMLDRSTFAILVMTGEDLTEDGKIRARQNVIHELGLFQGRLGFSRAIVLLEEATEQFSNIHGIHQIRYSSGNIKEAYGEILATLRRECGT